MTEIIQIAGSLGVGAFLAVIIFLMYRRDRRDTEKRIHIVHTAHSERLESLLERDQETREENTKVMSELNTLITRLNGRLKQYESHHNPILRAFTPCLRDSASWRFKWSSALFFCLENRLKMAVWGIDIGNISAIIKGMLNKCKCKKCGNEWYPRSEVKPSRCPKCQSRNWDKTKQACWGGGIGRRIGVWQWSSSEWQGTVKSAESCHLGCRSLAPASIRRRI